MSLQSEKYYKDVVRIYSSENHRSALVDIKSLAVYLFNGNHPVITTNKMNQDIVFIMTLCKKWVNEGSYAEADFAA